MQLQQGLYWQLVFCISIGWYDSVKSYPGLSSAIQKSAGLPGSVPNPTLFSWRPMKQYPNGWRHDRKKEVEVGRFETVRVRWETGILDYDQR